ncbi:MAG: hypothetical protein NT011_06975 [Kiritimatiellaeota bacterium]|nr:hypothetical protein [Kiritimatiellota bacterium]
MGTSVNHPSPKTTSWRAASLGYQCDDIPADRVAKEIWRAATTQDFSMPSAIASQTVFRCHEILKSAKSISDAIQRVTADLVETKNNSIIAEFAKRAIPAAFSTPDHAREWRARFFGQLTDYLVSRDIPGYVGENYRSKSIREATTFKTELVKKVTSTVRGIELEPSDFTSWQEFVRISTDTLSGVTR